MSRKERKRSGGSDQNKAIARWDNEGGAPKGAPQEDRNELAPLTNEEEHQAVSGVERGQDDHAGQDV